MDKNFEEPIIKLEPEPVFPEELTPKDTELVKKQCEIQHATSRKQVEGFANAYLMAKELATNEEKIKLLTPEKVRELILELGGVTEPKENEKGFRIVPASFEDSSMALNLRKINQAIDSFCQGFVAFLEDPTEDERLNTALLYKEFEKIHPFKDGNGRVGDLLWKILETRKTGKWPEELPPDVFEENKKTQ